MWHRDKPNHASIVTDHDNSMAQLSRCSYCDWNSPQWFPRGSADLNANVILRPCAPLIQQHRLKNAHMLSQSACFTLANHRLTLSLFCCQRGD